MIHTEAPQWLLSAWRRSIESVGATADREAIERTGADLIERWGTDERVHHNLKRLIGVLARVDELSPETHDPDVVRIAAWYHGAVFTSDAQDAYARRGGADAEGSADLARVQLEELGVPESVIERVAVLVKGLSRHVAPANDIDAQALCDADLGVLAGEPQRYEAYRREVRAEYAHIPQRDYVEARMKIVSKLLERKHLFASPLGHAWEDRARENLVAERTKLDHELSTLPPRAEGEPSRVEEMLAAKAALFAEQERDEGEPAEEPRTAADRVDVARRAAQERADERRAAADADRERRRLEKEERSARRARERAAARSGRQSEDGSSMSRPPSR